jgi:hypothetical protein
VSRLRPQPGGGATEGLGRSVSNDPTVTLRVDLGKVVLLDGMGAYSVRVPATIYVVTDPSDPDEEAFVTVIRVNRGGYIDIGGKRPDRP